MDRTLALCQQLRESMSQEIADRTRAHQAKITSLKTVVGIRSAAGVAHHIVLPLLVLAHGDLFVV